MKYIISLLLTISFFSLKAQSQNEAKPLPDFDSIDLSDEIGKMFNMIDSLPMDLNSFGNMSELFKDQFGGLSEDNEMFQDLLGQSLKMMENIDMSEMQGMLENLDTDQMQGMMKNFDMSEMQGLMDNFMKDFEGMNLEELFETEKMEEMKDKPAKRKKI